MMLAQKRQCPVPDSAGRPNSNSPNYDFGADLRLFRSSASLFGSE